jgi:glutathione S-transferase
MHYAEGSLMPLLVMKLIFSRIKSAPMPFFAKPVARLIAKNVGDGYLDPQIRLHLAYLEDELGKSSWFAGEEFTAADVQMSFPLEAAAARAGLGTDHPRLQAWLDRVQARPAYQRALQKGGPVEIMTG